MDTSFGQFLPATPAQDNQQYMVLMRKSLNKSAHQGTVQLLTGSLMGEELKILSPDMCDKVVDRMFGVLVICGAFC